MQYGSIPLQAAHGTPPPIDWLIYNRSIDQAIATGPRPLIQGGAQTTSYHGSSEQQPVDIASRAQELNSRSSAASSSRRSGFVPMRRRNL